MNRQPFLIPALLLLTVARFLMLSVPELSAVEAHAIECSHDFDFWHVSLGPVIPLLIKVGTALFGESAFGIRFFAPILILGASLFFWHLCQGLFDATTASWALVIFSVTPAVNLAAVTLTPTTLGIFSGVSVLTYLRLALHTQDKWHRPWWLVGLSLTVAFMTDWRLIMLTLSVAASLVITSRGRRALLRWPVIPILVGCVGFAVTLFLAWNSEHGWLAMERATHTEEQGMMHTLLQVLLVCSPLLLLAIGWTLTRSALDKPIPYSVAFVYAFTWPLLTLDLLCWGSLPWPNAGYGAWIAPATMLLGHQVLAYEELRPKLTYIMRFVVLFMAALQSVLLMHGELARVLGFVW